VENKHSYFTQSNLFDNIELAINEKYMIITILICQIFFYIQFPYTT